MPHLPFQVDEFQSQCHEFPNLTLAHNSGVKINLVQISVATFVS
jgi:hypothetical protein